MQIVPFADGDAVRALRARLDAFYANTTDYPAFCALPDQSGVCTGLRPILGSFLAVKSTVRVLEVGAGRPTFHEHFADLRDRLIYDVQDVTAQNVADLRTVADHVWIGCFRVCGGISYWPVRDCEVSTVMPFATVAA